LVFDIRLAIIPAGFESSIVVEHNSTVNEGKRCSFVSISRRERGCDGSHSRANRQALAMRGFQAGELAGNRQEKKFVAERASPICSFDGYDNLIGTDHVQASSRRRFNGAWIRTQLLNLQSQGLVCITQLLNVTLHPNILLGRY
jgi:hypothetical protein